MKFHWKEKMILSLISPYGPFLGEGRSSNLFMIYSIIALFFDTSLNLGTTRIEQPAHHTNLLEAET
jgi:hypothetical protein